MRKLLLPFLVLALSACSPAVPQDDVAEGDASGTVRVGWRFTPAADSTEELPRTQVSVVLTGAVERVEDVGTYNGNATDEGAWEMPPEGVTMAASWWAGAGDELLVVRPEPERLVVRLRWIDAESETGYGEYEDVIRMEVPADARVVAAE